MVKTNSHFGIIVEIDDYDSNEYRNYLIIRNDGYLIRYRISDFEVVVG